MDSPEDNPVKLSVVRTEQEAAIIVASLADEGIEARTTGDFTAGFRAEAPGSVEVWVKASDAARSQEVLGIEVPETSESDSAEGEPTGFDTWRKVVRALVLFWLVVAVGLTAYTLFNSFFRP